MTEVASNHQPGNLLDLGAFVGELTVEDDLPSDDISLEGLEQELQDCKTDDVVATILSKGTKLRDYTKDVENNLRQIELDSIEDPRHYGFEALIPGGGCSSAVCARGSKLSTINNRYFTFTCVSCPSSPRWHSPRYCHN